MSRSVFRLLLLAGLLAGCDRARIDPVGTELLVADPDLGVVQLSPALTLRLRPPEASGPLTVTVSGREAAFDSLEGAFVIETTLARGLNRLPVTVVDDAGTLERDTLDAVYLPIQPIGVPGALGLTPRSDAAAAALTSGVWLVSGGLDASDRPRPTADIVRQGSAGLLVQEVGALAPRTGHTATSFDGGALLVGGTSTAEARSGADFAATAEWVDAAGRTRPVEVVGGIARTRHTTRLVTTDGVPYLYLYGGVTPSGDAVTRSGRIDVYEVAVTGEGYRLTRLSPSSGSGDFTPVADHLQVQTGATSAAILGLAPAGTVAFGFDWTLPGTATFPFSLRTRPVDGLFTDRTRAAAADLGAGLSLVLGGRTAQGEVLGSLEVYAGEVDRSFLVPLSVRLQAPRYDHVATILGPGRIVIGGGRGTGGAVLSSYESFQL